MLRLRSVGSPDTSFLRGITLSHKHEIRAKHIFVALLHRRSLMKHAFLSVSRAEWIISRAWFEMRWNPTDEEELFLGLMVPLWSLEVSLSRLCRRGSGHIVTQIDTGVK